MFFQPPALGRRIPRDPRTAAGDPRAGGADRGRTGIFRVAFRARPAPLISVCFRDETVSGRFDLNAVRAEYRLTRRASDLLGHLLDGMGNREIADDLGIVEQTVKEHLGNVYRKVGVKDRYDLLRRLVSADRA